MAHFGSQLRLGRSALSALLTIVLLLACSARESAQEREQQARVLLQRGETQQAIGLLRTLLRDRPEDPELRLVIASAYLEDSRGDLAEVALDQALERGIAPERTLEPRARALLLQKRFAQVRQINAPDDAPVTVRLGLELVRIRALETQVGANHAGDRLTKAYLELFRELERAEDSAEIERLRERATARRREIPAAERAWQHHECAIVTDRATAWEPLPVAGRVLRVGPDRELTTPGQAAEVAGDGDLVEIDAGTYVGGVARWPQSRLTVRGIGTRPVMTADGKGIERRDVWLFTGDEVTVENVALSGARSPWGNGAGIRHVGSGLVLRHVLLEDNEMGLLTGNDRPDSTVVVEFSEFRANVSRQSSLGHNVYIGRSGRFVMRASLSHEAKRGHLVKSRARENEIAYSRIVDGPDGGSSYLIDLPEGGKGLIIGNEMQHAGATENRAMISFGSEGILHDVNELTIASNSIYNQAYGGILLRNHSESAPLIVNNLMGGAPHQIAEGPADVGHNLVIPNHGLVDPRRLEFSLTPDAPAIDAAVDGPVPTFEYVHPAKVRSRKPIWRMDVGAHERCGI